MLPDSEKILIPMILMILILWVEIFSSYATCVTVNITEGVEGLVGVDCVPLACSCPSAVVFEYFSST
jgi:hypothetical protein